MKRIKKRSESSGKEEVDFDYEEECMKTAAFIGIPLSEFYKMTPKEFYVYVDGFNRRKEIEVEDYKIKFELEQKALIHQAYLISRWVWTKNLPIEKILNELGTSKDKKEMTDEQMLAQAKVLNALFGGEVKEK